MTFYKLIKHFNNNQQHTKTFISLSFPTTFPYLKIPLSYNSTLPSNQFSPRIKISSNSYQNTSPFSSILHIKTTKIIKPIPLLPPLNLKLKNYIPRYFNSNIYYASYQIPKTTTTHQTTIKNTKIHLNKTTKPNLKK